MYQAIKRLPLDRSKRYFVIGDIHGRFQTFLNLLEKAKYDEENDVLISVGDLIDRGPKSFETVDFFTSGKPNVHVIMGNHEYMAGAGFMSWSNVWLRNGGVACMDSIQEHGEDHSWLVNRINGLPWILEVGEDDDEGSFRVAHADVHLDYSDQDISDIIEHAMDEDGRFDAEDPDVNTFIWSRKTITKAMTNLSVLKPLTNEMTISSDRKRHNYVGHTPIQKVTTVHDVTFVDTWSSRTMSMVEALSGDVYVTDMAD